MKLKDALASIVPKSKLDLMPSSFDIVGDIAIVEITPELERYEKKIASTLLDLHKNIKVVVKKHGIHKGTFRKQAYRILAGERRKTTLHKENGIRLKLHIEHTYFSSRSATERLRIATLAKKGERVLVMFGGVAPFSLVLAKNSAISEAVSVELNPLAHSFAVENIALNKARNVKALLGDVRNIVPKLGTFDRVLMPLPKDAEHFLDVALSAARSGGTIHLYTFGGMEDVETVHQTIKAACKAKGKRCIIKQTIKCGQFSPRVFRLCTDFTVRST